MRPAEAYAVFTRPGQRLGNGPNTLSTDYAPMIERDYTIRAGGICACIVNISMEKFEQVIKEMAYYKMNELWTDEYLLGSGSFQNYPQIIAAAREKFGPDATEHDLLVWFINEINEHVKSEGANLRIWNDGIPAQDNTVKRDNDIMVEYWYRQGRTMEKTLSDGSDVVNTDNRPYFTRNNNWGAAQDRWNENWTPHSHYGRPIDDSATPGKILGGKMVLWPDYGPGKTENQLFSEIHETLRFPCLAMAEGDSLNLRAPNTFGQEPIVTTCTSTPREAGNLQKWWIRQVDGGYTISNAISNMPLVVDGANVAQQDPIEEAGTVFAMVGDGVAATTGSLGRVIAGVTVRVPVIVRNLEDAAVSSVLVTPVLPDGWLVDVDAADVGNLAGQAQENLNFRIPSAGPAGAEVLEFVTSWTDGAGEARERTTSVPLNFSCTANVTSPSEVVRVSSEQNDTAERAPAINVIDGNPTTFWHTRWNGAEPPHPHQLVVGLAESAEICAVTLTPRQGVSSGAVNGQIKGFELYATNDRAVATNTTGTPGAVPAGWTKVAEGELPGGQSPQWIPFTQPVEAQYLLLVSKSAQNPAHPWTTLGEFSVDLTGQDTTPPVVRGENASVVAGTALSLQVRAADASAVTFAATGLPTGLSISDDGLISGTTTVTGAHRVLVTVTDAGGLSTTVEVTITVTPKATPTPTPPTTPPATPPTTPPTPPPATPPAQPGPGKFVRSAPYTLPGNHVLNGRQWMTTCEDYSQTERCRTDIWATVVKVENGQFVRESGWAFNNLTYLPYMTRESWKGNPLGDLGSTNNGQFTSAGRQWRTECDTAATGRGACRSYTMTTVYAATAKPEGGYAFSQSNQWVFNNIVMFGSPAQR
ncbi:discoidin domain-containing protein [Tessaracoccus massiliensis]|uniref:discoidin domain-containing protein n=1 Tax=Tessaracoccus massiliensis TaxID=1522311 RepID=UPI0005908BAA|nr:discoidin domain-containing protein [Tessaracoccus massiliensis]